MASHPRLYSFQDKLHFLFGSHMNAFFSMFFRVRLVIMYPYFQDSRHPQEVPKWNLDDPIMLFVFDTHARPSLHWSQMACDLPFISAGFRLPRHYFVKRSLKRSPVFCTAYCSHRAARAVVSSCLNTGKRCSGLSSISKRTPFHMSAPTNRIQWRFRSSWKAHSTLLQGLPLCLCGPWIAFMEPTGKSPRLASCTVESQKSVLP